MKQETMSYDVIIIGAGPSGLAAAIRLKQLARKRRQSISVCILEKSAHIGAHILSGAILKVDPDSEPHMHRGLQALLPDSWDKAPLYAPVMLDTFYYLGKKRAIRLPTPKHLDNQGNFIISLGELCQFLAKQAERLGCEIYPGFPAARILYHENGGVIGVETGEVGIDKQGNKTNNYQPGMRIIAKQTFFAEGCRGQLSQQLMTQFQLRKDTQPQTYGLGMKEIWQIPTDNHRPGQVIHTVGWPLDQRSYGGSYLYYLPNNQIALGLVVGLDYQNPWLNPFAEFQQFKTHPFIRSLLANGERLSFGARALNEGGWQSLPKLTFPGGVLIGDAAGTLNPAELKGIHTAIESGIYAAETCLESLSQEHKVPVENTSYGERLKHSWIADELYHVRNIRPGFRFGLLPGLVNAAFELYVSRGKSPWTLKHRDDRTALKPASRFKKKTYPKPDGVLTFDIPSSVALTHVHHVENQPIHLQLRDPELAIAVNYKRYASPETRYCPAGVYEIIEHDNGPVLTINAANCIHCKTCDIKDPTSNILWTAPEGGGGPNYQSM